MGRKKISLAYISDETERENTFMYRQKELIQKLEEVKSLCDIEACAVINPINSNPEVWPSNSGVISIIEKFEMLTEKEKMLKSVTQEGFLNQQIAKLEKVNKRLVEENKEKRMRELMFGCLGGDMGELSMEDDDRPELCQFMDQYLKTLIHHKTVTLNTPESEIGESSSMAMAAAVAPTDILHSSNQEVYIPVQDQVEFYDPKQNQNQQEFVEEMMELGEQTSFPWMEDNSKASL